jgi:hypothetical protein
MVANYVKAYIQNCINDSYMDIKTISIELSAKVINDELLANLSLVNDTSNEMYLDEQTICYEGRVRGDFFKIKNEQGEDVDYTGLKVSRDIKPENFIILTSGQKIEVNVNLSKVYELIKGMKYTIQYSTYHPSCFDDEDLTKIESNKVEISF